MLNLPIGFHTNEVIKHFSFGVSIGEETVSTFSCNVYLAWEQHLRSHDKSPNTLSMMYLLVGNYL
jgi:hypothetical protein